MTITSRSRRRRPASRGVRLAASVAITAATAAVAGSNVYASWTSSASDASGTYSAATVTSSFSTGGSAFSTSVSNMLPGDYSVGYTSLQNTGSVTQAFTGAVGDNGGALADAGGLQITVDSCSVAWTEADGTCSGTTTSLVAKTDVANASAISYGSVAAAASKHIKVRVELPSDAADSFQGDSAVVTITATGSTAAGSDRSAG
ncbi:MAG TPA: hypothetical protein VNA20_14725 [Frankiaceae bacterium]|nr:hypothetical protein [Frankiaceae bacterium]